MSSAASLNLSKSTHMEAYVLERQRRQQKLEVKRTRIAIFIHLVVINFNEGVLLKKDNSY
jgi:hypothetical protein